MKKKKNKWKSKALWLAIASVLLLFLQNLGLLSYYNITDEQYNKYITLILTILSMLGVIRDNGK